MFVVNCSPTSLAREPLNVAAAVRVVAKCVHTGRTAPGFTVGMRGIGGLEHIPDTVPVRRVAIDAAMAATTDRLLQAMGPALPELQELCLVSADRRKQHAFSSAGLGSLLRACSHLEVLDITGNRTLKALPQELATHPSLQQLRCVRIWQGGGWFASASVCQLLTLCAAHRLADCILRSCRDLCNGWHSSRRVRTCCAACRCSWHSYLAEPRRSTSLRWVCQRVGRVSGLLPDIAAACT